MKLFFFSILVLFALRSEASEGTFRFGIMPTISVYNVIDPYGPTQQANAFSYTNAVMFVDMGRDDRMMTNLFYDRFALSATQTNIGQDVTRTGGSVSYQTMWRLARNFKPWVGLGLGAASEAYKGRYTLSPGGFSLPATPADRSLNAIFAAANVSIEWQASKALDMGLNMQFEQPAGDGTRIFRVGLYLVY